MVVAGGDWQVPMVKKAKEMGHIVLCTNLYDDSPAFKYADIHYVADVLDKGKNLQIARLFHPDIVITDQSDIAVPTVAYISEQLNLPGIGQETAELFTNKFLMRKYERKMGFCHPLFFCTKSYEEALKIMSEQAFDKMIIKPLNSQSSRGVYDIYKNEDFQNKYEIAKSFSSKRDVLIEEYIEGPEFTVDGIKLGDSYYTLAISKKKHFGYNNQIASDLFFSWDDRDYSLSDLENVNKEYIKSSGLCFGLTHAEYKFKEGQYYLIEMAARGGGTLISSDIAPYMSGINGPETLINYMLKKDYSIVENRKRKAALLHFFDFPCGRVISVNGIMKAAEIQGVKRIKLEFEPGDIIKTPDNDRGRVGFVIIIGQDEKTVMETLTKVENAIEVKIETDYVCKTNQLNYTPEKG